jgi:hypothetical protein
VPTQTATPTETSTPTSTPRPTETPNPDDLDDYEPNDNAQQSEPVGAGTVLTDLTLHNGDQDWFIVRLTGGRGYFFEARITGGGDPKLRLFNGTALIDEASDGGVGAPSPSITFYPDETMYALLVVVSEMSGLLCRYELMVSELMPTATPIGGTLEPTPTPSDGYEPNGSFGTATELAMNYPLQAAIGEDDNDFYKFYVEYGIRYQCEAVPRGNLDTNLIAYDQQHAGIGGNNNTAPDDPTSTFSWVATYEGWVYLLVGPVAGEGVYEMLCTALVPTPVPTYPAPSQPGPGLATAVPTGEPETIPTATEVSAGGGDGADNAAPGPQPTAGLDPTLAPPIRVVTYYDKNDNGAPDPAEGIVSGLILLLDVATNKPLNWAQTDQYGFAEFRVPQEVSEFQSFRISVPFLGFSKRVSPGDKIDVEIEAQRLPGLIP